jgi:hypothetical protein
MTKNIFSLQLASRLCKRGFEVVGTHPNPKKPWLLVYEFEATEEFLKVFEEEVSANGSNES